MFRLCGDACVLEEGRSGSSTVKGCSASSVTIHGDTVVPRFLPQRNQLMALDLPIASDQHVSGVALSIRTSHCSRS
jgi:hypothetical protein